MNKTKKRECPRESFMKANIPLGVTKHSVLRSIMKEVLMQINPATTSFAAAEKTIMDVFDKNKSNCMLSFEKEDEAKRMVNFFKRYLSFERRQLTQGVLIAKDFSNDFMFAGQKKSCTVHYLIDRDSYIEAIRFKYKSPEYSYKARDDNSLPAHSSELLMLQRSGECEAKKLGINIAVKPVFGSIYYMKHRDDKATLLATIFEERPGDNIITYCFAPTQADIVEKEYTNIAPDASKTCDEKLCSDCLYNDLCHLSFEKRHLMERPPVETKTIDEVKLTDAQYTFVNFKIGECRVNAVAGAGKTTVVALRTLALIEEGASPEKILMVTFSEKAKEEMFLRLKGFALGQVMAGTDMSDAIMDVQIETFNSWGQHTLDKYYGLLGFSNKPILVDDVQKKDIIVGLLNNHRGLPLDYRNPFMSTRAAEGAVMKMVKYIDAMKAAHVETELEVLSVVGPQMADYAKELLEIYQEYNHQLLLSNAIDYEDQLRLLLKLKDFGVFEKLPYEHIVVDEFQDSNPNQIAIIVELKKRNRGVKSLVVVGDELQAIYGFRNATPDNLVDFAKYFPNMVDIDMTANFRSQQPIIQLANQIIAKTAKLGKFIEAHKKSSKIKPAVMEISTPEEEQSLFTRQVKKLLRDGTAPSDIAILCLSRKELIKQQMELDKEGIPTILKVPEIIADAPYVKVIIAFASFLKDPNDLASLALYAKSLGQDPFDEKGLVASKEAILKVFDTATSETEKIDAFMRFLEDAKEDYVAEAFIEKMKGFHFNTLLQYLNYCTKYRDYKVKDTQSTSQQATDCVTLITTHSSKGLEWHTVLLSLKRFPLDDESKRLFYVGVTRAKERLLVTYTKKQLLLANLLK